MTITQREMGRPRIGEEEALSVECFNCGNIYDSGAKKILVPAILIGPDVSLTQEQALLIAQAHEEDSGVNHDIEVRRWFGRRSDFAATSS